jgi:hypothetical protein
MSIKMILAGIGALALIGGLAACGSAGGSVSPTTSAGWYQAGYNYSVADYNAGDTASAVGFTNADWCAASIDQADLVSGNPLPDTAWPPGTGPLLAPSPMPQASGDAMSWINGCAAGSAAADGSASAAAPAPADTQVTDPAGNTCSSLDSAGYCPGDDPAGTQAPVDTPATQVPATQAAPAPVSSAPAAASVRPAFGCYVNENEQVNGQPVGEQLYGATIDIQPGTGTGYSTATVKVTFFDKNGNVLGTDTVTATSSVDQNEPWQTDIYPDGGPVSLATEASCTATVESAS